MTKSEKKDEGKDGTVGDTLIIDEEHVSIFLMNNPRLLAHMVNNDWIRSTKNGVNLRDAALTVIYMFHCYERLFGVRIQRSRTGFLRWLTQQT